MLIAVSQYDEHYSNDNQEELSEEDLKKYIPNMLSSVCTDFQKVSVIPVSARWALHAATARQNLHKLKKICEMFPKEYSSERKIELEEADIVDAKSNIIKLKERFVQVL